MTPQQQARLELYIRDMLKDQPWAFHHLNAGTKILVLTSELGYRRLAMAYLGSRNSGGGYSQNLESWYFTLEYIVPAYVKARAADKLALVKKYGIDNVWINN